MPAQPGQHAPALTGPLLSGGTFSLADQSPEKFTIVVFYRGEHCPICKGYVKEIEAAYQGALEAGFNIVVVSMDNEEKAKKFAGDVAAMQPEVKPLSVPILYNMDKATALDWGLYLSSKRENSNEPEVFSEPALFAVDSKQKIFMAQVQSAPISRPDIQQVIGGLTWAKENNYPARGTLKQP